MATQYDKDQNRITWIQFQSGWDRNKRNKEIAKIEAKMNRMEQRELNANAKGKSTGYYTKQVGGFF